MSMDPVETAREGQQKSRSYTGEGSVRSGHNSMISKAIQKKFPSFKRGGKVKKTGLAKVHKGETVVPAKKRGKRRRKER